MSNSDATSREHLTRRFNNGSGVPQQDQDTRGFDAAPQPNLPGPDPREPGKAQAKTLMCSECGGAMVWASTDGYRGPISVYPYLNPAAWSRNSSDVIALVCTDCGFTKFYTSQPRKLLE